jgi:hypothetical protein
MTIWWVNALLALGPELRKSGCLMEVLSPSIRDFDSIGTLAEYKSVADLEYILFVEPNEPFVSVWSRDEGRLWRETRVTSIDEKVELPALGAALEMRALHGGMSFPAAPRLATTEPPR